MPFPLDLGLWVRRAGAVTCRPPGRAFGQVGPRDGACPRCVLRWERGARSGAGQRCPHHPPCPFLSSSGKERERKRKRGVCACFGERGVDMGRRTRVCRCQCCCVSGVMRVCCWCAGAAFAFGVCVECVRHEGCLSHRIRLAFQLVVLLIVGHGVGAGGGGEADFPG